MNKRILKLLNVEQLPAVIETSQISNNQKLEYAFLAKKHVFEKEDVLEVTFFSLDKRIAEFRVFFNSESFVTEKLTPEPKWIKSTLDSLIYCWTGEQPVCTNEETKKLVCCFFNETDSPYQAMLQFQRKIRKAVLDKKHKKITDKIDKKMELVPARPEDFISWIDDVVFDKSRYIYYKRISKNKIDAFCTSCLKPVEYIVSKNEHHKYIQHNQQGKCPDCNKDITYKAVGKTTSQVDKQTAAVLQKTEKGFVIRYFVVRKEFKKSYKNPQLYALECVRDFYENGTTERYEWNDFKQTRKMRWCESLGYYNINRACLYTSDLRQTLGDTQWKYSGIYDLAKNTDSFEIGYYLDAYTKYPVLEYLVKLRLYKLISEAIVYYTGNSIDLKGKDIQEVLGIDKQSFKQLQRINGGERHLKLIRDSAKQGILLKDDEVNHIALSGINIGNFIKLLKYTTAHKAIKYINYALSFKNDSGSLNYYKKHPWIPENDILSDWLDYIQNCKLLKYDLKNDFVLFPKDLKSRHDEAASYIEEKKDELLNKAIMMMSEQLEAQYGYTGGQYIIMAPKSADEITAEGQALKHCVGKGFYIDNMAKGKTIILFVRLKEQPDKPFYTMEFKDGSIVQCRGMNNCSMTDDVKKFTDTWLSNKICKNSKKKGA